MHKTIKRIVELSTMPRMYTNIIGTLVLITFVYFDIDGSTHVSSSYTYDPDSPKLLEETSSEFKSRVISCGGFYFNDKWMTIINSNQYHVELNLNGHYYTMTEQ